MNKNEIDVFLESIKSLKSRDLVSYFCEECKKQSQCKKSNLETNIKRNSIGLFCSLKCKGLYYSKINSKQVNCINCSKYFKKNNAEIKKSSNHFCSKSCAATYNNKHKKYGIRRSKLEIYIEKQIRLDYPDLELLCNDKSVIESELDFYFPNLKLAIELNGIFHYEPIYGLEKLSQIQKNDCQKFKLCHENNIELCIIDSSNCKYLTQQQKDKFYNIFASIINQKIKLEE